VKLRSFLEGPREHINRRDILQVFLQPATAEQCDGASVRDVSVEQYIN
jgi:hypothetical protein